VVALPATPLGVNHQTPLRHGFDGARILWWIIFLPGLKQDQFAGNGNTGRQDNIQTGFTANALTAFEQEWVQAIHDRQVFPVFQPIVDSRSQLQ
ncbi:hypothetical protein FK513_31925, partial [Klebsiella pneumoniae]|uniref:hypothetical protein n=1 Tax=Klebsiella pneumoniae TaxID=573 RepID=UPI00210CFEEA